MGAWIWLGYSPLLDDVKKTANELANNLSDGVRQAVSEERD